MPALENDKWEEFAHRIATGAKGADAVRAMGSAFNTKNPRNSASALTKRPEIRARIAELRAMKAEVVAARQPDPEDFAKDPKGWLIAKHMVNLSISEARADTKESRATLRELAELESLHVKKVEATVKSLVETITAQQWVAIIAAGEALERLSGGPTGPVVDVMPSTSPSALPSPEPSIDPPGVAPPPPAEVGVYRVPDFTEDPDEEGPESEAE